MVQPELHILHLDDDALYLEQFAAALRAAPLGVAVRIESVDDVAGYFAALARGAPDIVVLDINVGGDLCGQDVARQTKALHPSTLVVMCSDLKGVGLVSACLSAGADDFLFKGGNGREVALRLYGTWKLRAGAREPAPAPASAVGVTMQAVAVRLERIVPSAISAVHLRGESGTGKEAVSEMLAALLPRGTPLVRVNCGAIAPTLLESELFGHVRGAFTGAVSDKAGVVEQAHGGWIFFDEVATLPMPAQIALLRVLENHTVRRVGGTGERKVNIRVLSATNEPIERLVQEGRFRGDLWQRLREAEIELTPLRQRRGELPELVRHFCRGMTGGPYEVSDSALEVLLAYEWRDGNVRELRNCLRAMTEMAIGKLLTPLSLPKWFWERADAGQGEAPGSDAAPASAEAAAELLSEIRLTWAAATPAPPYDHLAHLLLLQLVRREAFVHGKVSVRHLARAIGVPKSTLAGRLRQLVDLNIILPGELTKLVSVGRE